MPDYTNVTNTTTDAASEFIEHHIKYIRKMSTLTDGQMRSLLRLKLVEDPSIVQEFSSKKAKKEYQELSDLAKTIKANPNQIARKVDRLS